MNGSLTLISSKQSTPVARPPLLGPILSVVSRMRDLATSENMEAFDFAMKASLVRLLVLIVCRSRLTASFARFTCLSFCSEGMPGQDDAATIWLKLYCYLVSPILDQEMFTHLGLIATVLLPHTSLGSHALIGMHAGMDLKSVREWVMKVKRLHTEQKCRGELAVPPSWPH